MLILQRLWNLFMLAVTQIIVLSTHVCVDNNNYSNNNFKNNNNDNNMRGNTMISTVVGRKQNGEKN